MKIDLAEKILARSRLARWWRSPAAWVDDCMPGIRLAPYQREILDAVPVRKRVAVRGPHGLGKTFQGSLLVLWFATTRDLAGADWKVITTASVWRHLQAYLWPEIHKLTREIEFDSVGRSPFRPGKELLDLHLKLATGAATPVASNQPERIEGAHAKQLLYLFDEAKIVPPATWDSAEGAFSNAGSDTEFEAFAFAMSTPGAPAGRFYDIHRRAPGYEDWWTRHVTLAEAVGSGRISGEWAEQRKRQWGADSAVYHNRVLGEFHASDEDAVIPLAWIEAAIERWHEWNDAGRPAQGGPEWTGVDVGRGGDDSILALRDGPVLAEFVKDAARDTMRVVGLVQVRGVGRPIVDVTGVGAGVFDRLREIGGVRPVAYAGAGKAQWRDVSRKLGAANVRSAAYWRMRELLDPAGDSAVALPPDELMISDLTTPTWEIVTGLPPKIKVEPKEKVVERLGRSPDRGDACLAAGTLISAEFGDVPIERVQPGMRVWTRRGLRPVLASGRTGVDSSLVRAILEDGRVIEGTGNHPVWDGVRFRDLDTFAMADSMWTWQRYPSSIGVTCSRGIRRASAGICGCTSGPAGRHGVGGSRRFTSRSIRRRSGRYRKGGTFTTRTVILSTTDRRISKRSRRSITPLGISPWRVSTTGSPTPLTCSECRNLRRSGTHRRRGLPGTVRTGSDRGWDGTAKRARHASDAAFRSRPSRRLRVVGDGAHVRAMFGGTTRTEPTALSGNVRCAERPSVPDVPEIAPVRVAHVCESGIGDVWNLEVEGVPEYFANGVLVHNCVMSFWADHGGQGAGQFAEPQGVMPVTGAFGAGAQRAGSGGRR